MKTSFLRNNQCQEKHYGKNRPRNDIEMKREESILLSRFRISLSHSRVATLTLKHIGVAQIGYVYALSLLQCSGGRAELLVNFKSALL